MEQQFDKTLLNITIPKFAATPKFLHLTPIASSL